MHCVGRLPLGGRASIIEAGLPGVAVYDLGEAVAEFAGCRKPVYLRLLVEQVSLLHFLNVRLRNVTSSAIVICWFCFLTMPFGFLARLLEGFKQRAGLGGKVTDELR